MPKNKPPHKHRNQSYTFYSLHIPILLLLIGLAATTGYIGLRAAEDNSEMGFDKELSAVLGDDDKDEDDNSGKGSKDKDDDRDDDKNDDRDDDKDDDRDDDRDDDKDDDRDDDKDDDRDDDKDDDRDDDRNDEKYEDRNTEYKEAVYEESKTVERIQNEDGTLTIKETETEDDGEIKVEIRTYDANGNKIRVEKYEGEDGEEKSRVKVYDEYGNKLSDFRLETEDGKELELRIKEGETELSRVRFDLEKQELVVKTGDTESQNSEDSTNAENEAEDSNRIRIRLAGNSFVVTRNGVEALSMFPLTVDDETGDIFVNTPVGLIELNAMPDSIVQRAQLSDDIDNVTSVELGTGEENTTLEYILVGEKREKLLGLFELQIPVELIYDAESGDFLEAGEQSFRTKVLELFSF